MVDPVVMKTLAMKEAGVPLAARIQEFPLLLLDLIFPFMMEYLVSLCEFPFFCPYVLLVYPTALHPKFWV